MFFFDCIGQGRLDGAFCDYSEKEKMSYIQHLNRSGVTNIEMESLAFAALTHHAGIRAAVVCVSILDRMVGDQVSIAVCRIASYIHICIFVVWERSLIKSQY